MNGGVILMGQMEAGEPLVPNRVRELRENKLMTQAQLARKAKVA
jgi:DNA-binding XRE family transcriptional regulator